MLGDVDDGAAKLAADREPLEDPKHHEQQRRRDADCRASRQHADQERREAHDRERDQERVLAADAVADPAEHERPERAHDEADREGREREDEGRRRVNAREEMGGEIARERAIEEEVVPLEERPERRGADDVRRPGRAPQAFRRKTGSLRPIR